MLKYIERREDSSTHCGDDLRLMIVIVVQWAAASWDASDDGDVTVTSGAHLGSVHQLQVSDETTVLIVEWSLKRSLAVSCSSLFHIAPDLIYFDIKTTQALDDFTFNWLNYYQMNWWLVAPSVAVKVWLWGAAVCWILPSLRGKTLSRVELGQM